MVRCVVFWHSEMRVSNVHVNSAQMGSFYVYDMGIATTHYE
jgi:hypothetical protein